MEQTGSIEKWKALTLNDWIHRFSPVNVHVYFYANMYVHTNMCVCVYVCICLMVCWKERSSCQINYILNCTHWYILLSWRIFFTFNCEIIGERKYILMIHIHIYVHMYVHIREQYCYIHSINYFFLHFFSFSTSDIWFLLFFFFFLFSIVCYETIREFFHSGYYISISIQSLYQVTLETNGMVCLQYEKFYWMKIHFFFSFFYIKFKCVCKLFNNSSIQHILLKF